MTTLNPRTRRLATELESLRQLAAESDFFEFDPEPGEHPERYVLRYSCFGLVDRPQWGRSRLPSDWRKRPPQWLGKQHTALLYLPAEYPRVPPQVRMMTPIYHPNIRFLGDTVKEMERLAEQVGGTDNLNRLFQENSEMRMAATDLFAAYICLDGLKGPEASGYYTPRLRLRDICTELGQMIMYQRYNTASPLNSEAAKWTIEAEQLDESGLGDRLPIDNRDFITKELVIRILRPAEATASDINIEIVGDP